MRSHVLSLSVVGRSGSGFGSAAAVSVGGGGPRAIRMPKRCAATASGAPGPGPDLADPRLPFRPRSSSSLLPGPGGSGALQRARRRRVLWGEGALRDARRWIHGRTLWAVGSGAVTGLRPRGMASSAKPSALEMRGTRRRGTGARAGDRRDIWSGQGQARGPALRPTAHPPHGKAPGVGCVRLRHTLMRPVRQCEGRGGWVPGSFV